MIAGLLRRRLILRPVLLRSVIGPFRGLEHTFMFYELVREYLPGSMDELRKLAPDAAAAKFVSLFSKRYFEISAGNYNAMDYLVRDIPVDYKGLYKYNYENYHSTCSQILAEVVCACPFEQMSRMPVLDGFKKKIGEVLGTDLIKKLPSNGCDLKDIEKILADSPYPGFRYWCQWLYSRTGNQWLDNDKYGRVKPAWDRRSVNKLSREWKAFQEIDKQMKEFEKWLKGQFPRHSEEVINYIAPRVGKPLIDVFGEEKCQLKS